MFIIIFKKGGILMKSNKVIGLFAAAILTTIPLAGCGDDEDTCYDSQGNEVACDSADVDVDVNSGVGDGSDGSGG
jgi:hypothetical protein